MLKMGKRAVFALSTVLSVGLSGAAYAEDAPSALTITGSVSLASQYRFRGISLSNEEAAISGGVTLNHESGAYGGFWASNIDGFGELGGSNIELDLYGGYKLPVGGATLDVGLLYYAYPGSSGGNFEFFEPYANISGTVGPVTLKGGLNWGWSQAGLGNNSNIYVFTDAGFAIPETPVTLKAHFGYSDGNTPLSPTGSYTDWLIGADFTIKNLTLGVAYVDTNLSATENRLFVDPAKNITDGAFVVSLTAAF